MEHTGQKLPLENDAGSFTNECSKYSFITSDVVDSIIR